MKLIGHLLLVSLGFALGVLIVGAAAQTRVEAGIGMSMAKKPPDGMWYQDGLAHQLQLKDRSYSFGLSGDTPIKGLRWSGKYFNLGQFASHAEANADDNDDASRRGKANVNPADCPIKFAADCHYNWNGSGGVRGLLASLGLELFSVGPVKIGLEAGPFIYKATWREVVSPIDCPGNKCWEMQIDKRTGLQVGPEFGLTARWDYIYAAARYFGAADKITAGYAKPIKQFEVGVSIPL